MPHDHNAAYRWINHTEEQREFQFRLTDNRSEWIDRQRCGDAVGLPAIMGFR
jgi:hypothetical protein